jgi:hypothetical protein
VRTCACGNVVPENRAKHCSDPCRKRAADLARRAREPNRDRWREAAAARRLTRPRRTVAWGIFDERGRLVDVTLAKGRAEAGVAATLRGCSRVARVVVTPKATRRERAAKAGPS